MVGFLEPSTWSCSHSYERFSWKRRDLMNLRDSSSNVSNSIRGVDDIRDRSLPKKPEQLTRSQSFNFANRLKVNWRQRNLSKEQFTGINRFETPASVTPLDLN